MKSLSKVLSKSREFIGKLWAFFKRRTVLVFLVGILIGFGLTWYFRGNVISGVKEQLSSTKEELSYYTNGQGCVGVDGIGGTCPEIKVVSAKQQDDPKLKDGQHFVIAAVEFTNTGKQNASIDLAQVKLKESNNYIFPVSNGIVVESNYEQIPKTYPSLSGIPNLLDSFTLTLGTGEKVRGNLIYTVSKAESPFRINYYTSQSEPFNP